MRSATQRSLKLGDVSFPDGGGFAVRRNPGRQGGGADRVEQSRKTATVLAILGRVQSLFSLHLNVPEKSLCSRGKVFFDASLRFQI